MRNVKYPGQLISKMNAKKDQAKKVAKKMEPKGKKGLAQVKKLGRTLKTGGFAKIAKKAGKKYTSKEAGKKVAGAIFQKMAKAKKMPKVAKAALV